MILLITLINPDSPTDNSNTNMRYYRYVKLIDQGMLSYVKVVKVILR